MVIYQHPLAYLLGLEGLALLRAFNGEYDREFTMARIAEIRALLDSAERIGDGAETAPVSTLEGYAAWAAGYDQPGNRLIDLEQPVVRRLLDGLPRGTALDAACGTGRQPQRTHPSQFSGSSSSARPGKGAGPPPKGSAVYR